VHELEEAEVERQLLLRDAAMRTQPGAQQLPEALDGIDVMAWTAPPLAVAGAITHDCAGNSKEVTCPILP
jgi:hypothetical protein